MACLETIIGLSRTGCNCFENMPANFDDSDSTYYIDELEGLNLSMVNALNDCEQGGVWDILTRARENAIKDFKSDLLTQIGAQPEYKKTIENINYVIGSVKYTTSYNPGTVYAGVRIYPRQLKNGRIKLNSVKLIFNTTAVIQCHLFNNLSSTPIQSFTINCIANQATASAALNYELPMYVNGEEVEYYLVYELPVAGLPLQNKINCSSCTGWTITCCDTPCFGNRTAKDQSWVNNLMIGGIKGDTWDDLDGQTGVGNQNNGFILNLTLNCDYEDIICGTLDFTNGGGVPFAMAKAVQFKAGFSVVESILSSGNINRYMMIDRERLIEKRREYLGEYNKRLIWLSQNMDIKDNGCYTCEPRVIKGGIMA